MKWHLEWALIPLIILASFFYMDLDGLPLDHPGNLKAADPFYHVLTAEAIIDSHQWNYFPAWLGLNNEKAMNGQPPLPYIQAAAITEFTGAPSWTTVYFIVCLFAALAIGMAYFLVEKAFKSTAVALLSAFALVVPLKPHAWLYQIYIGLWIQTVAYAFIIGFVWMVAVYWQDRQTWQLWIADCCILAIMLVHPQDLLPLFPVWLALVWRVWTHAGEHRIKHLTALVSLSAVVFLVLLPRFIFVWGGQSQSFTPGIYTPDKSFYGTTYSGGLVFPEFVFFPIYILILALLGIAAMAYKWRTYVGWFAVSGWFFILTYVSPYLVLSPYYLVRMRSLQPYIIIPAAALIVVSILWSVKVPSKVHWGVLVAVGLLVMFIGHQQYAPLLPALAGEHVPLQKWQAYEWIHVKTPSTSKIIMLEGVGQANPMFTKRITATVEPSELLRRAQAMQQNASALQDWHVTWNANTIRGQRVKEIGFLSYERYDEFPLNVSLTDFDYIYFENENDQISQLNQYIFSRLPDYRVVYNSDGYLILGRI